jgi:hypothetical protein
MVDFQANTDMDGGITAQTWLSWRNGMLGISQTKCFVFLVEGTGKGSGIAVIARHRPEEPRIG